MISLRFRDRVAELIRKNLFRSIKYSLSGYLGFFALEIVTFLGLRLVGYSRIVEIDAVAFFTGVSLEFLVNEYWTTRNEGLHEGSVRGIFLRLGKFQVLNLLGNIIAISIQLALLRYLGVYPLIGNIVGSAIAFPFNYVIQMKSVWGIETVR